jgi:hypothetical protein
MNVGLSLHIASKLNVALRKVPFENVNVCKTSSQKLTNDKLIEIQASSRLASLLTVAKHLSYHSSTLNNSLDFIN